MTFAKVNFDSKVVIFGLPFLIILFCISLSFSTYTVLYPELAAGVTYDLTLTVPLLYLFLIRKQSISNFTVIPVFGLCVLIGTLILPAEKRFHLDLIITWILPFVEIVALGYLSYSVYKAYATYKSLSGKGSDMLIIIRETCHEQNIPNALANVFAFEMACFYYAFFSWKTKRRENTFTYHRKSGFIALYLIIIFIILAESVVVHVLIAGFSNIVAWIFTISSIYVLFQVFAHLKASIQRPIEFIGTEMFLHYGLLGDIVIDADNIENTEATSLPFEKNPGVRKLGLLGDIEQHNLRIDLKKETGLIGFYGFSTKVKTLYFFVDEHEEFMKAVELMKKD